MVLRAQLSDWRKFRVFQRKIRAYYQNTSFSSFVNEVRERRRRHEVDGDVRLLLSPEQQSRLENWMEFQNYHLKRLEGFAKKRDKLKKELDDARRKAEVSEHAAEDAEAVRQQLENAKRDLERHKVVLQWIEQKRQTMDTGHPTPTEEDNDDRDTALKAVRTTSTRDRRTRRAEASTVLGKIRITKAKSKKRNTQIQKPKALEFEPTIQDSEVTPQSSISQAPKRRETRPRRTKKETPLGQIRSQRVSKEKRFAGARAKSLSGTQRRGDGQTRSLDRARSKRRPAPQRPQPAPEHVTTRIGRISRPLVRWAPEFKPSVLSEKSF